MKKYISIFLFLLTSNHASSQSGWFWLNPLPQGSSLNSIKFVNSQTGFAVGNFGANVKMLMLTANC